MTPEPAWATRAALPHPSDPPTLASMLQFDVHSVSLLTVFALCLAALYVVAVIRVRRQGVRWSTTRTLLFVAGCALIVIVTGTELDAYGEQLFSVFMFQQLTLMIAVPPLLVWGSPGRLLLRAVPHRGLGGLVQRAALGGLRSRWARVLLHPAVTVPIFLMSYYGLYFTGIADNTLRWEGGHVALETAFLAAGVLFHIPVLSDDPLPVRHGHVAGILDIFIEIALHAFFGVIIMMSTRLLLDAFATPPGAWGIDPLADQGVAGGLAWGYGEGPTVLILIYLLHRWFRDDTRRDAARDQLVDRDGDPELDAYNTYLARLNAADPPPTQRADEHTS